MITVMCVRSLARGGIAALTAGALVALPAAARAQATVNDSTPVRAAAPAAPSAPATNPGAQATPGDTPATTPTPGPTPGALSRWIDIQTGTVAARYRYIETSTGAVTSNHLQGQVVFKGRFKFDRAGRLSVNALAATGSTFTTGWNNTGWGTGDLATDFSLKHLFVAVVPVKGVDVSFGSFAPVRGESTEITTFDNDAYLMGEHVSVKRPMDLYFDEIGFTSAYVGDLLAPSVFDRGDRLTGSRNYFQYFVAKRFSTRVAASADYVRQSGTPIVHTAVTVTIPLGIVDSLKYEQYVRGGEHTDWGFSVYAEKVVAKRLALGAGYATIDEHYGGLNADRFNRGNRIYESATIRLTPDLSMLVWAGQAVATDYTIANKYRFDAVLTYNVLGGLQRAGWLK